MIVYYYDYYYYGLLLLKCLLFLILNKMSIFQNTWIECTGSLFLDCMVSVSQIIIDDSTTSNPLPDVNITPGAVVLQANLDNALQCHLHQEPESNVMPKVDLVADTLRGITAQVIPSTSLPQSKESNLTRKRRYTPELNTTGTTNPTKNDTNINTVNLHDLVTTLCTQLERTGCMSQSGLTVTEEQSEMYREIENIVTKDTSEAREETNLSTSYGFPFHLIHRYLAIIKDPSQRKNFASTFNIPLSTNVAVSVIADWLGNIFRSLGSDVMQRVEEFKRENITSINALPASEELVCKLFPQCMIRLMLAWMGNEDSPVLDTLSSDSQPASSPVAGGGSSIGSTSTCYVSKSYCSTITDIPRASTKHSTEQQQHVSHHIDKIYALAQIILEFANNTLVSGVAHVVYSRL